MALIEAFTRELALDRKTLDLIRDKATRMPCGLDTESSGPQLRDTKRNKPSKKNPEGSIKYKDFINMWLSTTTGWSIAFPDKTSYYVPLTHRLGNCPYQDGVNALRFVLQRCPRISTHNLAHELFAFRRLGIEVPPQSNLSDTLILAWLTHHDANGKLGLKALAKKCFGYNMATFKETTGGRNFSELTPLEGLYYACDDAIAAVMLEEKCRPTLKAWDLEHWYQTVEMPCVWVVREMEDTGVSLDREVAEQAHREMTEVAQAANDRLKLLADIDNPNSPKQLQAIYDQGHWDPAHAIATKTGYSFNDAARQRQMEHLDKDSKGYQIAQALSDFKDAHKLASTYTLSLLDIAGQYPDGRLHPSFHQTGTVTGRFSSSYPNGQNMPVRSESGRKLLSMFCAEDGLVWGSADFSQVELRVLAHFAGGPLRSGYQKGHDVHQSTADRLSSLLGVDISRSHGKTLNFAKIYGAHDNKLAGQLNCDVKTARKFRLTFEKDNPHIMKCIDRMQAAAYARGYIRTLGGRRRAFPRMTQVDPAIVKMGFKAVNQGLLDKDQLMRHWADEREAVNSICQGGAADITKKAMVQVWQKHGPMVLQAMIHDDIRIESPVDNIDEAISLLVETMQQAWPELKVPLVADSVKGRTWRELKG